MKENPFVIGVAGGSGSGKTFFAKALKSFLGEDSILLYQDNFYIDQSENFDHDGGSVNFDHPDSLDLELLANCLLKLKSGYKTEIPQYDFKTHKRLSEKLTVEPRKVIIVDGILIFHHPHLRDQFDEMIFFDTPEDLRFQRRLFRDVQERGRTAAGVREQFMNQVKPMHDLFVAPSKKYAQTVVKDIMDYQHHMDLYKNKLQRILQ